MKAFVPALLLACLVASPALSQTLDITVRGGQRSYDTRPADAYPYYNNYNLYDYRSSTNFDPAGAALNAGAVAFPKKTYFNVDRMITLNATGDSMLAHQLKCQAAYPTYEPVSDTYLDRNGLARPCRL